MKGVGEVDFEENTYKQYYFPLSDDEDQQLPSNAAKRTSTEDEESIDDQKQSPSYGTKRTADNSIDEFFVESKKKKFMRSSTVGRTCNNTMSYISTNVDDGLNASHLIKIEVFDEKKLANVPKADHWKHADVRIKYYAKPTDALHKKTRGLIYQLTRDISNSTECKKFSFKNNDK